MGTTMRSLFFITVSCQQKASAARLVGWSGLHIKTNKQTAALVVILPQIAGYLLPPIGQVVVFLKQAPR